MKWNNVKLIFLRESRDQLRDRRTLFTIAVLPLLLYPLMGMVLVQISQFMQEHPTRVRVIGRENLPQSPPLIDGNYFHADLCSERERRLLPLEVTQAPREDLESALRSVEQDIQAGRYEAAIYFPPTFSRQLEALRGGMHAADGQEAPKAPSPAVVPAPAIYYNTASEKSRMAHDRTERVLQRWRELIVRENLRVSHLPEVAAQPFQLERTDVARDVSRRAAMWSKVMPFIVLIWALTGAFYPAIDLCAGEKERGTLETLLSSPCERSEIVWGKLLTVMAFSMATALLNLTSIGITTSVFLKQYAAAAGASQVELGTPPLMSIVWLIVALIPASALFSALALAIAAFARSSKEGQYYLMPLLLVTFPLMLLPMLPTAELSPGTSLIPVSGLMMLLRGLIEGHYREVLPYVLPVAIVTLGCCLLAIRWAIDQFSNESVLFREGERGGLSAWWRHMIRVREETPSIAEALACGLLLLIIRFFATAFAANPTSWPEFVTMILVVQLALIATPALLMTLLLTRSPRQTLLLRAPRPEFLVVAGLLAVALRPLVLLVGQAVQFLYPLHDDMLRQLEPLNRMLTEAPLAASILVVAVIPAICEELAFRGFILSGLRHMGHKWGAIVLAAFFFGWTHSILQQQISATLIGIVIGYVAVQTGSLFPAIVFHLTHNGLTVLMSRLALLPDMQRPLWMSWFFQVEGDHVSPTLPAIAVSLLVSSAIVLWLKRIPYRPSSEERLREAIDHQTSPQWHGESAR